MDVRLVGWKLLVNFNPVWKCCTKQVVLTYLLTCCLDVLIIWLCLLPLRSCLSLYVMRKIWMRLLLSWNSQSAVHEQLQPPPSKLLITYYITSPNNQTALQYLLLHLRGGNASLQRFTTMVISDRNVAWKPSVATGGGQAWNAISWNTAKNVTLANAVSHLHRVLLANWNPWTLLAVLGNTSVWT